MSAGVRMVEASERGIHGEKSGYASVQRGREEVSLYQVFRVVTKRELYKEFEKDGYIMDVFVSRKKRKKTMSLFAFIRYNSYGGAMRAIDRLNVPIQRRVQKWVEVKKKIHEVEKSKEPETKNLKLVANHRKEIKAMWAED
ncbi:hypothetical protein PIB30_067969 [Stylosanthes scabra]|uniref:RRM domain-containing protein n=1 Tax=Stylosanthes scabra TaxID=79078 RepID=A0ABU6TMG9_9FABA|nr:hypothetical protein [Stylosanthes scabra]